MNGRVYYQQLIKPSWSPPAWIFGPVWTALYILIAISFIYVFQQARQGTIPFLVALPFILNLIFNIAFTPIQWGIKNNVLTSLDVLLTVITLIWATLAIWPYFPWVAYLQIPYLAWGAFATVLQLTITYLNRQKIRG